MICPVMYPWKIPVNMNLGVIDKFTNMFPYTQTDANMNDCEQETTVVNIPLTTVIEFVDVFHHAMILQASCIQTCESSFT